MSDALAAVDDLAGGLSLVLAVNREYAAARRPPGGRRRARADPAGQRRGRRAARQVAAEPLSLEAVTALVGDPRAGAVVSFQGVTREVHHLDYEAYEAMAVEAMRTILRAAAERHGLCAAAAEHRVGTVPLGEPSVVVAVSAPHRGEAFAGAREIIDELKARAPIWKREVEASGEGRWVSGAPPRGAG